MGCYIDYKKNRLTTKDSKNNSKTYEKLTEGFKKKKQLGLSSFLEAALSISLDFSVSSCWYSTWTRMNIK